MTGYLSEIEPGDTQRFLKAIKAGQYDYQAVVGHKDFICSVSATPRDVNVVLGCTGRGELLEATVLYLKKAVARSPYKVKIILSEMDFSPLFAQLARAHDLDYIFVPFEASETRNKHAEAFAYNIAYLCCTESSWYCFHCADTLVPEDWFDRLKVCLTDDSTFVQPYSDQALQYFTPNFSKRLIESRGTIPLNSLEDKLIRGELDGARDILRAPVLPGATGGSLLVRRNDFEDVGGYEPEIFCGWGFADIMIWTKLEFLYILRANQQNERGCWQTPPFHVGQATYPEKKIYLFHLHHDERDDTPQKEKAADLSLSFASLPVANKLKYLALKGRRLRKDRELVQASLSRVR